MACLFLALRVPFRGPETRSGLCTAWSEGPGATRRRRGACILDLSRLEGAVRPPAGARRRHEFNSLFRRGFLLLAAKSQYRAVKPFSGVVSDQTMIVTQVEMNSALSPPAPFPSCY